MIVTEERKSSRRSAASTARDVTVKFAVSEDRRRPTSHARQRRPRRPVINYNFYRSYSAAQNCPLLANRLRDMIVLEYVSNLPVARTTPLRRRNCMHVRIYPDCLISVAVVYSFTRLAVITVIYRSPHYDLVKTEFHYKDTTRHANSICDM